MKKILIIGLSTVAVVLLSAFLIVPIFAQTPPTDDAWQDMYQACQNGDWQAMGEVMQRMHGDGNYGTCHSNSGASDQGNTQGEGGMMSGWGGHMGGSMMGGRGGGMMRW